MCEIYSVYSLACMMCEIYTVYSHACMMCEIYSVLYSLACCAKSICSLKCYAKWRNSVNFLKKK